MVTSSVLLGLLLGTGKSAGKQVLTQFWHCSTATPDHTPDCSCSCYAGNGCDIELPAKLWTCTCGHGQVCASGGITD